MRSSNGGWHGLAGWGFRRFSEAGVGLRADDGANSVSHARSSLVAANLCLAELRSVSQFPGAEGLSCVLGKEARRAAVRCHRRALQADQASRAARRRRRIPVALRAEAALAGGNARCRTASEWLTSFLNGVFRKCGRASNQGGVDGQA